MIMDADKLRKSSNPYLPITHRITQYEFVGRQDEIEKLRYILEDYNQSATLKNVVVTGERSIGKSTLLHRFRQILTDYNFMVIEKELPTGVNTRIDEMEVLRDIIDSLFNKFDAKESDFFDNVQREIWYSLTSNQYEHSSNFLDRQLKFPSHYSNKKKNIDVTLPQHDLISDFNKILSELTKCEMEINGLAILIDEFQELSKNHLLLDILRVLSDQVTGLIIIGAGLPLFQNDRSFNKFCRSAVTTSLRNMTREDIVNLIYKPVENKFNVRRHDLAENFDDHSIREIVERSEGNPLHVRILCSHMYDTFKRNLAYKRLALTRDVMDSVMEYYSLQSDKSRIIRRSLESCTREKLEAFKNLYYFEGLNLKAAIHGKLAFESMQEERVNEIRQSFLNDIEEIFDLKLFAFTCVRPVSTHWRISNTIL
jgi:hypothetical protein